MEFFFQIMSMNVMMEILIREMDARINVKFNHIFTAQKFITIFQSALLIIHTQ